LTLFLVQHDLHIDKQAHIHWGGIQDSDPSMCPEIYCIYL